MPRLRWPSRTACSAAVFAIGIAHRLFLLSVSAEALRAQEQAYPGYLTWQFLRPESFSFSLGASMLYLQQGPPIPNLIVGLFIKAIGWPHGSATFLVAFEGLLSAAAGTLLFGIVDRLLPRARWAALVISVLFVLNPDLVVIEYNSLGQTFYEILAMTLVLALARALLALGEAPSLRLSWLAGVACALLALTRAPYSLVALPVLAAVWMLLDSGRLRHSVALLGAIVVLHGGWTLKNALVYGVPSPVTSSWGGTNFTLGMIRAKYDQEFKASILQEADRYPEWFTRLIRDHGLVHWHPPTFLEYVPEEVRARDRQIQAALGGINQTENTVAQRVLSDWYMRAHIRFALHRPDLVFHRFLMSYEQFWEPIRNYGSLYVSQFAIRIRITNSFDVLGFITKIFDGRLPEPQLQIRRGSRRVWYPTSFFVPNFAAPPILLLNLIAVHVLVPVVLVGALVSWIRTRRSSLQTRFLASMTILYLYAALTFNIAEYGENMRFRVSIEPVIWILSTIAWSELWNRGRLVARARSVWKF